MGQVFVGVMTEGKTDDRFLLPIIEKTLIEVGFMCKGDIEPIVLVVDYQKEGGFVDYVLDAAKKGKESFGMMILVVHSDADAASSTKTLETKITPALESLAKLKDDELFCTNLVPLIPIYETESWMLADKELFKKRIDTTKKYSELRINGHPEKFNNPKERIEEAIKIGRRELPKKIRSKISISDLYSPIGAAIDVEKLHSYKSYLAFRCAIESEFRKMNLL